MTKLVHQYSGLAVAVLAVALTGCGKESPAERMAGTYATKAVQAELEEHEKEFISDSLHGQLDAFDRAEAAGEGAVWARLRLLPDGRFEYEGPVETGEAADARLRGRWTARPASVDLVFEPGRAELPDALSGPVTCPASPRWVDLPFLTDATTGRPVRLDRR